MFKGLVKSVTGGGKGKNLVRAVVIAKRPCLNQNVPYLPIDFPILPHSIFLNLVLIMYTSYPHSG